MMEQLWAPWRYSYVAGPKEASKTSGCFLCQVLAENDDRANLVAWRGPHCCVVLNRFPYNNGHLLIAPNSHKAHVNELDDAETLAIQKAIAKMVAILEETIKPEAFNIGVNMGRAAGAGLPGHLHWHIVPRWSGDSSFMTVCSDTRVIVQSLESLYDLVVSRLT
jgi:ATP adenylyltransferase